MKPSLNRKRQIATLLYNDMVQMQLDMIDEAVDYSDLQKAKDVINYIKEKSKNDSNDR